jgi:hypothetical protein
MNLAIRSIAEGQRAAYEQHNNTYQRSGGQPVGRRGHIELPQDRNAAERRPVDQLLQSGCLLPPLLVPNIVGVLLLSSIVAGSLAVYVVQQSVNIPSDAIVYDNTMSDWAAYINVP